MEINIENDVFWGITNVLPSGKAARIEVLGVKRDELYHKLDKKTCKDNFTPIGKVFVPLHSVSIQDKTFYEFNKVKLNTEQKQRLDDDDYLVSQDSKVKQISFPCLLEIDSINKNTLSLEELEKESEKRNLDDGVYYFRIKEQNWLAGPFVKDGNGFRPKLGKEVSKYEIKEEFNNLLYTSNRYPYLLFLSPDNRILQECGELDCMSKAQIKEWFKTRINDSNLYSNDVKISINQLLKNTKIFDSGDLDSFRFERVNEYFSQFEFSIDELKELLNDPESTVFRGLRDQLSGMRHEIKCELEKKLDEENNVLKIENIKLQQEQNQFKEENKKIQDEYVSYEIKKEELEQTIEKFKENKEKIWKEVGDKLTQKQQLENDIGILKNEQEKLQSEYEVINKQVQEIESAKKQIEETDNLTLKALEEYDKAQKEYDSIKISIQELQAQEANVKENYNSILSILKMEAQLDTPKPLIATSLMPCPYIIPRNGQSLQELSADGYDIKTIVKRNLKKYENEKIVIENLTDDKSPIFAKQAVLIPCVSWAFIFAQAVGNAKIYVLHVEHDWLHYGDFCKHGLLDIWKKAQENSNVNYVLVMEDINLTQPECGCKPLLDVINGYRPVLEGTEYGLPKNMKIFATILPFEEPNILGLKLNRPSFINWAYFGEANQEKFNVTVKIDSKDLFGYCLHDDLSALFNDNFDKSGRVYFGD